MREINLLLFVSVFCFNSFNAQNFTTIKIGYERNLDLIKFTETAQLFADQGKSDVRSSTQKLDLFYTSPLFKSNWNGAVGVTYKLIKHTVSNYFNYSPTEDYGNGVQYTFSKATVESISKSIGIKAELNRTVHTSRLFVGNVGINTDWYLFEFYTSRFVGSSVSSGAIENPSLPSLSKNFFLSSCNLSAFYRCEWLSPKSNLNVALKISVGTNLYSDWDQFKRYAWVGVGAEIGLRGHKKEAVVLPN